MRRHTALTLVAGAVATLALACAPAEQPEEPTTFAEAKAQAADTQKLLLVDFYATW